MICGGSFSARNSPRDFFPNERGAFELGNFMLSWFTFLRNFPMGVLIGFFVGILIILLFGADLDDDLIRYGTYLLTLCATLLASATAFATAIWNAESQRVAKLRASKAALPTVLSQLVELADDALECALRINGLENRGFQQEVSEKLSISERQLHVIQNCIEYSPEIAGDWMSILLSHHQVYYSRLHGRFYDENFSTIEGTNYRDACDWLVFRMIVNHMFDFARGGDIPSKTIEKSLIHTRPLAGLGFSSWPQIKPHFERTKELYCDFSLEKMKL